MEKHVGLNPKWFEPGADGVSRFERLSATVGFGAAGISAAFRALLAEEEQVAPVEQHDERDALINQLRGEVEQGDKHADEIHRLQSELHARNDEITGLRGEVDSVRKSLESTSLAFNETRKQLDQFWNQRDAARAEVERLTAELRTCHDERITAEIERDAADEFVERMTAERDAERARVQKLADLMRGVMPKLTVYNGLDCDIASELTAILEGRDHA